MYLSFGTGSLGVGLLASGTRPVPVPLQGGVVGRHQLRPERLRIDPPAFCEPGRRDRARVPARCAGAGRRAGSGTANRSRRAGGPPARGPRRSRSPPRRAGTRGHRTRSRSPARASSPRSRPAPRSCGRWPVAGPRTRPRPTAPPKPAASSSRTSASWASRWPAADRQWRIAGLPVSIASSRLRRRLTSWSGIGLNARSKSRPVSPTATTRGSRAAVTNQPQAASSTWAASCGWTPTAASSQGRRSANARARSTRRTVPAGHEDALDAGQARSTQHEVGIGIEPVGLDVAVAVDEAHGSAGERRPAQPASAVTSSRGKSGSGAVSRPGRSPRAPQRSSSARSGPPLPSGP